MDLKFTNPSGHAATFPDADISDWRDHIRWIRRHARIARRWPPLLVVVDEATSLPRAWVDERDGLRYERVPLAEIGTEAKGLEYPHVVLVLSRDRLEAVQNGFSGTGDGSTTITGFCGFRSRGLRTAWLCSRAE